MSLRTEYQEKVRQRNAEIYKEWKRLAKNPNNSRTAISRELEKKYDVSDTTVWRILQQYKKKAKN